MVTPFAVAAVLFGVLFSDDDESDKLLEEAPGLNKLNVPDEGLCGGGTTMLRNWTTISEVL